MADLEDRLFGILKRTIFLWLIPYIFWFFGSRIVRSLYAWVTEPVPPEGSEQIPQT